PFPYTTLFRSGSPISSTRSSVGACGTCPAGWRSTCGSGPTTAQLGAVRTPALVRGRLPSPPGAAGHRAGAGSPGRSCARRRSSSPRSSAGWTSSPGRSLPSTSSSPRTTRATTRVCRNVLPRYALWRLRWPTWRSSGWRSPSRSPECPRTGVGGPVQPTRPTRAEHTSSPPVGGGGQVLDGGADLRGDGHERLPLLRCQTLGRLLVERAPDGDDVVMEAAPRRGEEHQADPTVFFGGPSFDQPGSLHPGDRLRDRGMADLQRLRERLLRQTVRGRELDQHDLLVREQAQACQRRGGDGPVRASHGEDRIAHREQLFELGGLRRAVRLLVHPASAPHPVCAVVSVG